jgi:hypothetical protein
MKSREGLKWGVLAVMALLFAYLGKINYQHRFTGLFALIVLGAVAVMLFIFYFLSQKES